MAQEMAGIGSSGLILYGACIHARDIESYRGSDPAGWLTQLVRAVVQATLTAEGLSYVVPQVTDRILTQDGGVDASLVIATRRKRRRAAGLINPGQTIYQFKWRSRRETIVQAARGELQKLQKGKKLPDTYVFVTNITLSIPEHDEIKNQLRKGCEAYPAERIVILGASELADRVNDDPRIRIAHFAVASGLCTVEVAREAAERRYGHNTPLPFWQRERERETLRAFLAAPERRALLVYGPPGVGKTRVVLEAVSSIPERVVWARELPIQPAGLIQVLDDSPYPAVLIIDDVEAYADVLLRRALEAASLKTIVICPHRIGAPGVSELPITPFSSSDAERLLGHVFPNLQLTRRIWLANQLGGLPGLLLQGVAALRTDVSRDLLHEPRCEAMLQDYEQRIKRDLGSAAEALEALSVLPCWSMHAWGNAGADLDIVCDALGVDRAKILAGFEVLQARNLLEPYDFSLRRVSPPLLARRLAERVLPRLSDQLPTLYTRLSPLGRAGLVQRIGELQNSLGGGRFLSWLLSDQGVFVNIETVAAEAASVRALAASVPRPTGRALRSILEGASLEARRQHLTRESRREIRRALLTLVHQRDTFEDGAQGLLYLAEAEDASETSQPTEFFTQIFHWKYPDIPKDARLRVRWLTRLTKTASHEQRYLIAKAAAFCLQPAFNYTVWPSDGTIPPEVGSRAALWRDVHDTIRQVIALLRDLASDTDHEVQSEAVRALARGVNGILEVGLVEEATAALEFLATLPLDSSQSAVLVEGVAWLVQGLKKRLPAAKEKTWRALVQLGIVRGEVLFLDLTSADFRSRFMHWLGPNPRVAHRLVGEPVDHQEMLAQGTQFAEEVMSTPALFDVDLQDWITDAPAQHGDYFLVPLGTRDGGKRWVGALEARIAHPRGVIALGSYLAGWHATVPADAEVYLDSLASRGGKWVEVAVEATSLIGGSSQGAKRLLRCVEEGGFNRRHAAHVLKWRAWSMALAVQDFLDIVIALRDGTPEVDWVLLEVLYGRWLDKKEEWHNLGPLVIDLLDNTAGTHASSTATYYWDLLAAAIVEWDLDKGFALLFAHFRKGRRGHTVFLAHDRDHLIRALSSHDRPRLARMLLETVIAHPEREEIILELRELLNTITDSYVLIQLTHEYGLDAVRLIVHHLDSSQPGFWEMMPALIVQWGDDPEVRSGILSSWSRGRLYSMSPHPQLASLDKLLDHPEPLVQEIAHQAKEMLLREIQDRY